MRRLAASLFLGTVLVPTAASACGNLSTYGRQLQEEQRGRYLDGAREVDGRWQLETQSESGFRSGSIHLRRGSRETGRTVDAYFGDELNCGFPIFPEDTAIGHFYLRRDGPGSWRIIHFISEQDFHEMQQQERLQ
ncbi:hypothetical protein [Allosphingosinicella sp.]|uniref:hypothetical protein n=1 Tax=Allosphingosinicella sp. TaxID=2823234 RepID=UPI003783BABB